MDFLLLIVAYLIGSLSFGRIAGVIRGFDMAERDVPGASGTFRQLGPVWGIGVALLDAAKGMLVAYLSQFGPAGWAMPLMAVAVVAGHTWPVFFGFRGGGGIAPTIGFFAWLYPVVVLSALAIGLVVAALYWQFYWKRNRSNWYPIPIAALAGYIWAMAQFWNKGAVFWAFLLVSVVVAVRGIRITQNKW